MDTDLIALLRNASHSLAAARQAAQKVSLGNYLFSIFCPRRKNLEMASLNTLDAAIACISKINEERSLYQETFRHALEGLMARHNASESRLAKIEHTTEHELARQTWVQELQRQLDQSVSHSTAELTALRSAESSHSSRLTQIEQFVQHDTASKAQREQAVQTSIQELQRQLDQSVSHSTAELTALRSAESSHSSRLTQIEQFVQHDTASKAQREQAVQTSIQELQRQLDQSVSHSTAELTALRSAESSHSSRLTQIEQFVQHDTASKAQREQAVQTSIQELLAILAQHQQQTATNLLELSNAGATHAQHITHLADAIESLNKRPTRDQGSFDSDEFTRFYLAFENRYRGSEEEIRDRLRVYLPRIKSTIFTNDRQTPQPIIDLGCGRGEWLQLLAEIGIPAIGIDTNPSMILSCREKELRVESCDALAYLGTLPDGSATAITAFHLIEHVPFPKLLDLFKESLRVLVPGGLAIFETPSCNNVLVGSSNFYMDPTHRHPLPNLLTTFALEHVGFGDIETLFLHPYPDNIRLRDRNETTDRFNDYFYGAQDYAVIARRPSP